MRKITRKKGWCRGIFCDSTWEMAFVLYHTDHGNNITRNTETFQYMWGGRTLKYIPDFLLDGGLVEIKGYNTPQVEAKIASCTKPLTVLYEANLKEVFEYVHHKYGKDFYKQFQRVGSSLV